MNEREKRLVKFNTEKGVSNWLTMLPITEEHDFELSKQQFWDSLYDMVGIFQHFVHAEVNSIFSATWAVKKVVL